MFSKLSIKKKLIICIFIGCFIPYLCGSFIIKNMLGKWLYNDYNKSAMVLLKQNATHVDDTILKASMGLTDMIVADDRIQRLDDSINSYINYDQNTFKSKNSILESEIMAYFSTIKDNNDMVTLASVGTEYGGYIEYPVFKPSAHYDPRTREWYKQAMQRETAFVSEPYITKVTKELVISLNRAVIVNNKKIGVVSLGISLENIMNSINRQRFNNTGYIDILSPNNIFINSPSNKDWLLKSVSDIKLDEYSKLEEFNGRNFEFKINGVEKISSVYISPYSGWKFISVVDKSEVLKQLNVVTYILNVVFLVTFIIMLFLILLISNYITKPILNIAGVIDKMAAFEFDRYKYKNFDEYTKQKDEIGEISRALGGMQDNFMELKSNLATMEYDIQKIDIYEGKIQKLELSENNPFSGITHSMNMLLEKVHNYVEQIKHKNKEILDKNDMLIASEKELKAKVEKINSQKRYINFLAEHDPLTNLPNRRLFNEMLTQTIESGKSGAVLMLDLDNFKGMNDTLGHIFGDKVLRHISKKLEDMAGPNLFISRFGGDEFTLLYEMDDVNDDLTELINKLFEVISEKFYIDQTDVKVEFSIGISKFPNDSTNINDLIMYADMALYDVKENGKNGYSFFNEGMAKHIIYRQSIKNILNEAVEYDGFKMVYQPQVEIPSGEIIGYEALIRLKKHKISPTEFITLAEEDSTIIKIGRIVVKLVVEQMNKWKEIGLELKPISINFSTIQLQDHAYKRFLFEQLEKYNIDPKLIVIEITESIFLENKDATINFLNELRASGIKIAVDDFGTGYSSLSYLTFLPIDTIKLDRSLNVKFLELENIAVMDSLIALAHSLNLKVVAEGIEEREQVKRLIVGKCDIIQGYYFSGPLEADNVVINYDKAYK